MCSPPSTRRLYWSRKNTKPISSFLVISYQHLAIMTTPRSRLWLLFAGCTSFNVPLFWAKNPPLEWSSNSAGALFNPTLHNRLRHFDIHRKSFSWIPHMPTFYSCGLVVEVTVESKANEAEKTREVADIRIYHFSWNFPQQNVMN